MAARLKLAVGDRLRLNTSAGEREFTVRAVVDAGGDEDEELFVTLKAAQFLRGLHGVVGSIEVSALTTPDNELARRAAQNPQSLSMKEMETWYCTAYVSSICYQIEEAITNASAKPVRQVAQSEGAILDKTELLMLLITIFSLVGSALGITNLVTASVMERSQEIGLMKALGARNVPVALLFLSEISLTALGGAALGYLAGIGFAQIIGRTVFAAAISIRPVIIPAVGILILLVVLAGSLPALRMLMTMRPAEVLHGGR